MTVGHSRKLDKIKSKNGISITCNFKNSWKCIINLFCSQPVQCIFCFLKIREYLIIQLAFSWNYRAWCLNSLREASESSRLNNMLLLRAEPHLSRVCKAAIQEFYLLNTFDKMIMLLFIALPFLYLIERSPADFGVSLICIFFLFITATQQRNTCHKYKCFHYYLLKKLTEQLSQI